MRKFILLIVISSSTALVAASVSFPSGLLRAFSQENPPPKVDSQETAVRQFIETHFGRYSPDFTWRRLTSFKDKTHIHERYALYYLGRRVSQHFLDLNFNQKGWVQYATSNWQFPFRVSFPEDVSLSRRYLTEHFKRQSIANRGFFEGSYESEPLIWVDPLRKEAEPAFEMKWYGQGPGKARRFIAHELSARVLEEFLPFRADNVSSKAWKVSPFNEQNDLAPDNVTLTGLEPKSAGRYRLKSSYFQIRRQVDPANPVIVHIDPEASQGNMSFTNSPNTYGSLLCTSKDTQECPNQRIDGMNVYFHLQGYRDDIKNYFTSLGVSPSPTDAFEPLEVFLNVFDLNGDGAVDNEVNNAGYFSDGCGESGGENIARCFIFLRPATASCPSSGDVDYYDLAREALIIVHEYQHFVTDTVNILIPGSVVNGEMKYNVGDALHEAYSDYFAASRVSEIAGNDVTKIGEYGFQNCAFYQRDLATLRPYGNTTSELDPHVAGLSFASGLWQLRKELGREKVDLLTLKSIFFLSALPGFSESVEALVKADKALNNGQNVRRIRSLFYDEIRWGSSSGLFRDPEVGIAEVGFRSCNAVSPVSSTSVLTAWLFGLWSLTTFAIGRFQFKRHKATKQEGEA